MRTYFISDLHLNAQRPQITRAFFQLLDEKLKPFDQLYILGDFFDAWIGDDDDDLFVREIVAALKKITDKKIKLFFMHGNRDFLIGKAFAQQTGCELLTDPCTIELLGEKTLLMHGDSLCSDDKEYQQFRTMVRAPAWQAQILSLPLTQRRALATKLREQSQSMNSTKAEYIKYLNAAKVITVMNQFNVTRLIHGHTHRPARHKILSNESNSISLNELNGERIVLGDWDQNAWALIVDNDSIELVHWPIEPHII